LSVIAIYILVLIIATFVAIIVTLLVIRKIIASRSIKSNERLYDFFADRFSYVLALGEDIPLGAIRKSFLEMVRKSRGTGRYSRQRKREIARRVILNMSDEIIGENRERLSQIYDALGFADDAIKELKDKRWWRQADAIRELQTMHSTKAVGSIITLLSDKSEEVRLLAFEAVVEIDGVSSLPILVDLLRDLTRWTAINLSRIILEYKNEAAPYILSLVKHKDRSVELFAIQMLGIIRWVNAVPSLIEIAEKGMTQEVVEAIHALGSIGDERAIPVCVSKLASRNSEVRAAAASALGKFGAPSSVESLIPLLDDKAVDVRLSAAEAISRCGERGMSALETAFLNGTENVAAAARYILDEVDLVSISRSIVGNF